MKKIANVIVGKSIGPQRGEPGPTILALAPRRSVAPARRYHEEGGLRAPAAQVGGAGTECPAAVASAMKRASTSSVSFSL